MSEDSDKYKAGDESPYSVIEVDMSEEEQRKVIAAYVYTHMDNPSQFTFDEKLKETDNVSEALCAAVLNQAIIDAVHTAISNDLPGIYDEDINVEDANDGC